jgi:DinB family protein
MIMPTREDYLRQPLSDRLARMTCTPDDLASAIDGAPEELLVRRPDAKNWAATEIICHLRDIEEQFIVRFHLTLGDMPPNPEQRTSRSPRGGVRRAFAAAGDGGNRMRGRLSGLCAAGK